MFQDYLNKYGVHYHSNQGVTVCNVSDLEAGTQLAKKFLYEIVDKNSVLYLSGGRMQRLYELFAKEETILPGAVGLIDERYGEPMHENSNEKMIAETKFIKYLTFLDIPFYPILQHGKSREESAVVYDEKVRSLQSTFRKHIGIIGIGPDGHTSSIIPNRSDFHNPWFDADHQHLFVSDFNDPNSHYKERVGMTFLGLSMLDCLIILAFGESKQAMFEAMFSDGKEEDIPARFFKRADIASKTLLITDQEV
ncbi:MAG TPA: 6-phosphogluconolactonase [Candidatus Saccharimonadales bacterium]|nr:6-phosphogluconolactonase [Candidatus Saccharimonadales bacterium]